MIILVSQNIIDVLTICLSNVNIAVYLRFCKVEWVILLTTLSEWEQNKIGHLDVLNQSQCDEEDERKYI